MNSPEKNSPLASIEEAIADIQQGKMLIVVDDEDRENEGDIMVAAEFITPEIINFMAKEARGLICTPVSPDIADRLNFHSMVPDKEPDACNFAVSVDARENIETGISAADRSVTIQKIVNTDSVPNDFVRPGHVFPLRAREGGVLVRAGHTEASVELAEVAGLKRAAVICEIMNDDGTMARLPDLIEFGKKHDIKIISIADFIAYRQKEKILVEEVAEAKLPTPFGEFQVHVFRETLTEKEHVALTKGDIQKAPSPLVRVHSECLTGDVFHSLRCDCGPQLDAALEQISKEESGVLLRIAQEGRGIGLAAKIKAYALQDEHQMDTVEANTHLGFKDDLRDYGIGAQILTLLGVSNMRLLTNNPRKIVGLSGYGLEVDERVPLQVGKSKVNEKYLETKKEKLGHLL